MKLAEIKLLEEPIPTQSAEEAWSEGAAGARQYITSTIYYVRPLKGSLSKYEVVYDQRGKRKTYGTLDEEDLEASFTPVRPNQQPDAEGFTQYRLSDVYDAFKWSGDPVKVTLEVVPEGEQEGQTVKLNRGDYLLRLDNGDEFVYTVERAGYFDNNYVKKI